ncbi:MAG: endosialidase [Eubacteriales bacterium]|nr:endosialidase [Eubacteriales bacterium]
MSAVEGLIRSEADGTISFGDYTLPKKTKVSDFENAGDIYKVKSFKEITKLEKNEMFVYESVPGTAVSHLKQTAEGVEFQVEGLQDAQITVEMEAETVYSIEIDGEKTSEMKTNLSGKLSVSVELEEGKIVSVKVTK